MMKLRSKIGTLLIVAGLAAVSAPGQASTAVPSKGIGVGTWGLLVVGCTRFIVSPAVGAAVVNGVPFGPVFSAEFDVCGTSANLALKWSGKGQLACAGTGTFTQTDPAPTVQVFKFAGPVTCHQLPTGLTHKDKMAATLAFVGAVGVATVTLS